MKYTEVEDILKMWYQHPPRELINTLMILINGDDNGNNDRK